MLSTIRIFISSPGDVADERQIAGKVIEQVQGKYWSFVRLDDVFWERRAVRATAHYQEELVQPGECEIVVGILCSRLGSPLPEKFRQMEGPAITGTEWELENAFDAYARNLEASGDPLTAKPDILVYRRLPSQRATGAAVPTEEEAGQEQALERYFRNHYFNEDGTIRRPILNYPDLAAFENLFRQHLEELVLRLIPSLKAGTEPPPISGSPFKGLDVFDFADQDRYFGRNRQIREVQQRLRQRRLSGPAFVLIYGASGYGKSSLMRAGVAPVITRPGGVIEDVVPWRRVLLQPAKGHGPLLERLARALLASPAEEDLLAAYRTASYPLTGVAEITGESINDGVAQPEKARLWDVASLARYLADDENHVFAVAAVQETLKKRDLHLLLQLDQLEEIFSAGSSAASQQERESFFRAVHALCRCPRVWGLATMRSEYFPRIAEHSSFKNLVGENGGYILSTPEAQMLNEIIRFPALAARLQYERSTSLREIAGSPASAELLSDQIYNDAKDSPDALPLLEFCLTLLYQDTLAEPSAAAGAPAPRKSDLLLWDRYVLIGGLSGAIATVADDTFTKLSLPERLDRVVSAFFSSLVRVDPASSNATRRRARLDDLRTIPGHAPLVEAFIAAKLLVTDKDDATGDTVTFLAHDCLLTHWGQLSRWIEEHRTDLAAFQRLAEQTELHNANQSAPQYLLSEGRLAEAERVAASGLFHLTGNQASFIVASRKRALTRLRFFQGAAVLFAVVALLAVVGGFIAQHQKGMAESARKETTNQLLETRKQLDRASLEEGRTWLERARVAQKSDDPLTALILAGRAVGFTGYGREQAPPEWSGKFPLLLGGAMEFEASLETQRLEEKSKVESLIENIKPFMMPVWSGPLRRHHAEAICCMSFSRDGKVLATASVGGSIKLWNTLSGEELGSVEFSSNRPLSLDFNLDGTGVFCGCADGTLQQINVVNHKVDLILKEPGFSVTCIKVSPGGKYISLAFYGDGTARVELWNVETEKIERNLGAGFRQVEKIAFRDDATLIFVDIAGSAKIINVINGEEIQNIQPYDAEESISAVEINNNGSMLAYGFRDGKIETWSLSSGEKLNEYVGTSYGNWINTLSFNPDGSRLAALSYKSLNVFDLTVDSGIKRIDHVFGYFGNNRREAIIFSPDGGRLALESSSGVIKLYNMRTLSEWKAVAGPEGSINSAAFSPDGLHFVTGSDDGVLWVWDSSTGEAEAVLKGNNSPVKSVTFSSDAKKLIAGFEDSSIKIWDTLKWNQTGTIENDKKGEIVEIAYSPESDRVGICSNGHSPFLWDFDKMQIQNLISAEEGEVNGVGFSTDGKRFACVSETGYLELWDVPSGNKIASKACGHGPAKCLAFSQDGDHMAIGFSNGTIQIFDQLGNPIRSSIGIEGVLNPDNGAVTSLLFLGKGDYLVASSDKGMINSWSIPSNESVADYLKIYDEAFKIKAHSHSIRDLSASPDGTRIISASEDGEIKIWNVSQVVSSNSKEEDVIKETAWDFLRLQQENLFQLKDGVVISGTNSNLFATLHFTHVHPFKDEISKLSSRRLIESDRNIIYMRLLSKSRQWRAAQTWWEAQDWKLLAPEKELKVLFLELLSLSAIQIIDEQPLNENKIVNTIAESISKNISQDCLVDKRVSAAIIELLACGEEKFEFYGDPDSKFNLLFEKFNNIAGNSQMEILLNMLKDRKRASVHPDLLLKIIKRITRRKPDLNYFLVDAISFYINSDPGRSELIAELALNHWFYNKSGEAIAIYRQLIENGHKKQKYENWADSKYIAELTWPDAEKTFLEALRVATLERHPELKPEPQTSSP